MSAAPTTPLRYPVAPRVDQTDDYFGTAVADPYRWLEDASSPKAQAWIEAQNAYADKVLSHEIHKDSSGISRLVSRVRGLAITSSQQFAPQMTAGYLYYLRETPPQAQSVLVAQRWPGGKPRVIVDPNKAGELTAITNVWPSADGRYVAYGTATAGTEDTTIHVVETATGRVLPDAPGARRRSAWILVLSLALVALLRFAARRPESRCPVRRGPA